MNCQHFEMIIYDLARDRIMEAAARESGLAHAEACRRCAARLADERALTAGLHAVAESAECKKAPARVEVALRAAFRQRTVAPATPASIPLPVSGRHWLRLGTAAAAVILLLLALTALFLQRSPSSKQGQQAQDAKPTPSRQAPVPDHPQSRMPGLADQSVAVQVNGEPKITRHPARQSLPSQRPQIARRGNISRKSFRDARQIDDATNATDTEIRTDFLPLMYEDTLSRLDKGQLVRVKLPRSALQTFGLPINVERAGEPIKADVLLGEDGLARAIRFVH